MHYTLLLCAVATMVHGSEYVTYNLPTLPLVITAPHGGSLTPDSFPERSNDPNAATSTEYCGYLDSHDECQYDHQYDAAGACDSGECEVKRFADSYTGTIASGLAERLETLTGRKPHLVKLLLKRNKLDANRLLPEATFGNPDAIAVYNEYYSAVDEAVAAVGKVGMLLDVHGHTHSHGMVELGYKISGTRLDNGLRGLNCWAQTDCVELEDTSIRGLIERKCTQQNGMVDLTCGQSIFSGQTSLGHYLSQAGNGYNVIPSANNPGPDGQSYFSGGIVLTNYGSRDKCNGQFDAIQIEVPRDERWNATLREPFINDLADAVVNFLVEHYGVVLPQA